MSLLENIFSGNHNNNNNDDDEIKIPIFILQPTNPQTSLQTNSNFRDHISKFFLYQLISRQRSFELFPV